VLSVPALLLCPPSLRVSETHQQGINIVQQMLLPIVPRIQENYRTADALHAHRYLAQRARLAPPFVAKVPGTTPCSSRKNPVNPGPVAYPYRTEAILMGASVGGSLHIKNHMRPYASGAYLYAMPRTVTLVGSLFGRRPRIDTASFS
jgi:hypothetical protein